MRDENKIYFPDRNIYLMDNHKWAFYIWELNRANYIIKPDATVFHVDAHLDDLPFVIDDYPEYLYLDSLPSIYKFTDEKVTYDTFIWPAFGRGTINNIIYVSDFPQNAFEDWTKYHVEGRTYEGLRVKSIEELKKAQQENKLNRFVKNNSLILNLDLDFFNKGNYYGDNPNLVTDKEVNEILKYLRDLYEWDLITIALSPECCGGDDACNHLLQIFLEVFELDYKKGISWSK